MAAALARKQERYAEAAWRKRFSTEKEFAEQILDLIAQQPDLTLVETVAELRKRRIRTSRSSLWRFLDRHGITLKKKPASCRTAASGCGASTPTLDPRARHA